MGNINDHTAHGSRWSQRYFKETHNHTTPGVIKGSWGLVRPHHYSIRMRVRLAPCKIIQECLGFWIPPHGFRIPGTELPILCQCDLESDFNRWWNYGFLTAVFRIPEPRIPSLALGTTVEERRTKKKSGREASRVVVWLRGKSGGACRYAFDAAVPLYEILVSCSDWSNVSKLTDSHAVDWWNITFFQFRKALCF